MKKNNWLRDLMDSDKVVMSTALVICVIVFVFVSMEMKPHKKYLDNFEDNESVITRFDEKTFEALTVLEQEENSYTLYKVGINEDTEINYIGQDYIILDKGEDLNEKARELFKDNISQRSKDHKERYSYHESELTTFKILRLFIFICILIVGRNTLIAFS